MTAERGTRSAKRRTPVPRPATVSLGPLLRHAMPSEPMRSAAASERSMSRRKRRQRKYVPPCTFSSRAALTTSPPKLTCLGVFPYEREHFPLESVLLEASALSPASKLPIAMQRMTFPSIHPLPLRLRMAFTILVGAGATCGCGAQMGPEYAKLLCVNGSLRMRFGRGKCAKETRITWAN